jgi:hypothetical protein
VRAAPQPRGQRILAQDVEEVGEDGGVVAQLARERGVVAAADQQRCGRRVLAREQFAEAAQQLERVGGARGGEQRGGRVHGGLQRLEHEGGALRRRGRVVHEQGGVEGGGGDEQLFGGGRGELEAVVDGEDVEERGEELALFEGEAVVVVGSKVVRGSVDRGNWTCLVAGREGFSASRRGLALVVYGGHSSFILECVCEADGEEGEVDRTSRIYNASWHITEYFGRQSRGWKMDRKSIMQRQPRPFAMQPLYTRC